MVRRFYITGGNNEGDPAVNSVSITDQFFVGKNITGVFKEGFRYFEPGIEWSFSVDTISILNGTKFQIDEVVIVEVSLLPVGATCEAGGTLTDIVEPYLPDIIKCIVARVNSVFENRLDDPFSVYYDSGLYAQVGNDRLKAGSGFLVVWLVWPFFETSPKTETYFNDALCDIFIAVSTEANYTQKEREDISFHPRLIPVYQQFLAELKNETKLGNYWKAEHTRQLLPYWGGGDMNAPGQPNLWKNYADCIKITGLKLKVENIKCPFTHN